MLPNFPLPDLETNKNKNRKNAATAFAILVKIILMTKIYQEQVMLVIKHFSIIKMKKNLCLYLKKPNRFYLKI